MTTATLPDAHTSQVEIKVGQELRSIGIPPRPSILIKIDQEMHEDEPDFYRLAEVIGEDVALSAGIIKVANSSYFGFTKPVRSVQEALLVLGLNTITHAISGMELRKAFQNTQRLERFWHSSAAIAHTSAWMAQRIRSQTVRPVDAYTFGLFHDCGIPLLMAPFKNYVDILIEANEDGSRVFTEVEDQHLSINHADIGFQLAQEWLLPEETCQAIRSHHDIEALRGNRSLTRRSRDVIAMAHLSEHFLNHHTGLSKGVEWFKLGTACLELLQIDDALLHKLYDESEAVIDREPI
jgi:HD-like signal output (HDOD) protein